MIVKQLRTTQTNEDPPGMVRKGEKTWEKVRSGEKRWEKVRKDEKKGKKRSDKMSNNIIIWHVEKSFIWYRRWAYDNYDSVLRHHPPRGRVDVANDGCGGERIELYSLRIIYTYLVYIYIPTNIYIYLLSLGNTQYKINWMKVFK